MMPAMQTPNISLGTLKSKAMSEISQAAADLYSDVKSGRLAKAGNSPGAAALRDMNAKKKVAATKGPAY